MLTTGETTLKNQSKFTWNYN